MTMPPTDRGFGFVHQQQSRAESRRASKPLMEKRRRARINHSLSQLKSLLLDGTTRKEAQNSRHAKLEKADILEMTVKHLRNIHQKCASTTSAQELETRFQAGFAECAREVMRFASDVQVDASIRSRLLGHLASCLASFPTPDTIPEPSSPVDAGQITVKIEPPTDPSSSGQQQYEQHQDLSPRVTTPLNLATSSRSGSSTSPSTSMPASPFSDTDSTTSASEEFAEMRLEAQTWSVIRRAPALVSDPVWRPW